MYGLLLSVDRVLVNNGLSENLLGIETKWFISIHQGSPNTCHTVITYVILLALKLSDVWLDYELKIAQIQCNKHAIYLYGYRFNCE